MNSSDPRVLRSSRAVLDAVTAHPESTRRDIQQLTGLASSTVSKTVSWLVETGQLIELSEPETSMERGRPPSRFTVIDAAGYVFGVSITHDEFTAELTTLAGRHVAKESYELSIGLDADSVMDLVVEAMNSCIARMDLDASEVLAVVVAIPAPTHPRTGEVPDEVSVVRRWRTQYPAVLLANRLGREVTVVNDANAAAFAECKHGIGQGLQDVLYVLCAQGVGGALVTDGQLHIGHAGSVGEIGHIQLTTSYEMCICGQRGCLESEISTIAMVKKLRAVGIEEVSIDTVESLLVDKATNSAVQRIVYEAGNSLGSVLAWMCNLLAPQRVILGAEMVAGGEAFLRGVTDSIKRYALAETASRIDVRLSTMGNGSALVGTTAMAIAIAKGEAHPPFGHSATPTHETVDAAVSKLLDHEASAGASFRQ